MDVKSFLRIDSGDHVVRTFQDSNSNRTVWRSPPNRGFGLSEGSGRWGQRVLFSEAKETRGKAATSLNKRRLSGRWGVAQACNCRSILDVIATLIEAQRPDLAMVLIEGEMNSQN